MNNLIQAFSSNGTLITDQLYTVLFNVIPSKYDLDIDDDSKMLDVSKINFDTIKHLFTNVEYVRYYYNEAIEESEDFEETDLEKGESSVTFKEIDGNILMNLEPIGNSLIIIADHKIVYVCRKEICVHYDSNFDELDSVKTLAHEIYSSFPAEEPEEKTAKVGLIKYSQGDYYTSFSDIRNTKINIEENYNDDFLPVYQDIENFLNQRESGLILLYGEIGTGKTQLIRHLCSNIPKDYVIVPNSVASRLGDPDFISYVTSCKDYVYILEDCEQLLMDRVDNPWNNAITTILNMADGLLSDMINIKFICTFNAEVDRIDKALLRKGRCFAKYEFKELSEDKVAKLNEKYNLGIEDIRPMTLAEIYNSEKTDYSEPKKKANKIGF